MSKPRGSPAPTCTGARRPRLIGSWDCPGRGRFVRSGRCGAASGRRVERAHRAGAYLAKTRPWIGRAEQARITRFGRCSRARGGLGCVMPSRRLALGTPVHCADAQFGELADVVIDPTTRCVTHLVVGPRKRPDDARIVPVDWVVPDGPDQAIRLSVPVATVDRLDRVHETAYLRLGEFPVADPDWDVGVEDMLGLPYFQNIEAQPIEADPHVMFGYDRVPKGEVEIRRASAVTAADGADLGRVDGFVVDGAGHISHVVLERGHLWGRREVTIPIGAVDRVENDVVVLRLAKDAVGALPAHRVHRWGSDDRG